jgi:uncharacterized membrane protein YkvA (DUF1232 family)
VRLKKKARLKKLAGKALGLAKKTPGLKTVAEDVELLTQLTRDYARKEYRDIPKSSFVWIVAALAYLVNPIDSIPDVIPILGFTDDIAFLAFVMSKVHHELQRYKGWRQGREQPSQ